jgi:acyl carrier protein
MGDLESRVLDVIAKDAGIDRALVTPESTLESLKIASVDLVQIVFALEVEFDITIPEDALGLDAKNVAEVVVAVRRIVEESKAGSAGGT